MAALTTRSGSPPATVFESLEILTPEGITFDYELAGIGARFLGAVTDMCVITFVALIVYWVVALTGLRVAPGLAVALILTAAFAVLFLYVLVLEQLWGGRTVGKAVTRTRVVGVDGAAVAMSQSAIRAFSWPFEVLMLPVLALGSAMISPRSQRLGDLGAGTIVIRNARRATEGVRAVPTAAAHAPDAPFRRWDVTAVGNEDAALARAFLERRTVLAPEARAAIGHGLASRLRPRVAGPDASWPDELLLEAIVAAKLLRD